MQRILTIIAILCGLTAPAWSQDEPPAQTEEPAATDAQEAAEDTDATDVQEAVEEPDTTGAQEAVPEAGDLEAPLAAEPMEETPDDIAVAEALASDDDDGSDLGNIVIGLHVGASLSVFSDLDPHVMPRVEFGYNLPVWGRRLEPFITLGYTPPRASGTVPDTRLPNSGEFSWEITQQELTLGLGILVRFLELGSFVNGYAAVGPQYVFLRTEVDGEADGQPFGENTEDDGKWGVYGALGVELVLGPGAAFFQLGLSWSDLNGQVTGDSNTGNLSPALGYRFMF